MGERLALAITLTTALTAALGACKHPHPTEPAMVTCDQVGASLDQALAADLEQSTAPDPSAATINHAIVTAVIESCNVDKWTAGARGCFVDARVDASEKCRTEITDPQAQALEDRMDSAVAKAAPAACSDLEPAIRESLTTELAQAPADQRAELEAKIGPFAAAVGVMCAAGTGWSVEARTCVRDASRDGTDAGRCARWLDADQRTAYQAAVEGAFGKPPPEGAGSGAGSGSGS